MTSTDGGPFTIRYDAGESYMTIQCAGVVVNPGDLVLGDEVGVVVISQENAAEVLKVAQELAEKEEQTRQKIKAGKTLEQLLEEFGRL